MKSLRAIALVLGALLAASAALAQARFEQIIEVKVRPGFESVYENFLLKLKEASEKTASPVYTAVLTTVGRSDAPVYRIAIDFNEWAERDRWPGPPATLAKAFGEQEAQRLLSERREAVVNMTTTVWERIPDASVGGDAPAKIYHVNIRQVRPEDAGEYESLQRKFAAAYRAAAKPPNDVRSRLVLGGDNRTTYRRVGAYESWADFGNRQSPIKLLSDHYGEEEARLIGGRARGMAVSQEVFVSVLRPDLSRLPAPAATSQDP